MIFVTESSLPETIHMINAALSLAIDTETTGKNFYKGDRLFSIIITNGINTFYFNFNEGMDNAGKTIPALPRAIIPTLVRPDYAGRIFMHNAKFDLKMLEAEGLDLKNHRIYDTVGLARLSDNNLMSLKLESLAYMVGKKKDKAVDEYIKENKLFTLVPVPTKKEPDKNKHFDKVPHEIMLEYGATDARITYDLGYRLLDKIMEHDRVAPGPRKLADLLAAERKLTTPVLLSMQDTGILIDTDYTKEAYEHEVQNYQAAAARYKEISGISFIDSGTNHAKAFTAIGEKYPLTEKGNPSFTDEVLTSMDTELSRVLKQYRYAYKKAHTYFANFLHLKDGRDVIHCQLNQFTGRTGRFSASEPNLQNLNRPRKGEAYLVRRSFVPRSGFDFFMLDFDQFEYRMMVNKAGEMGLITQILSGLDVHTATANLASISRQDAKTVNFLLLYGGGIAVLARKLYPTHFSEETLKAVQALHWEDYFNPGKYSAATIAAKLNLEVWEVLHGVEILTKAKDLKDVYFGKLPMVKKFVKGMTATAERGAFYNRFGRRYRLQKNFAYKAPNYLIQGETADWIKVAMCQIYDLLLPYKSRMVLQVHDELLFEISHDERFLVTELKNIMQNISTTEFVPYTVGAKHSSKSWADKEEFVF